MLKRKNQKLGKIEKFKFCKKNQKIKLQAYD